MTARQIDRLSPNQVKKIDDAAAQLPSDAERHSCRLRIMSKLKIMRFVMPASRSPDALVTNIISNLFAEWRETGRFLS
jgi:hypothetical protein